jgi:glutathione S-transferase
MAEYIEVEQAIGMSGLRIVLSPGLPAPWSESCKGLLYVKKLPYVKARQNVFGPNPELLKWTAQTTAPVAAWNDEPPRSTWIEQLYLFERLAPQPRLIPADWDDRVLMIGLSHEICGENGFTWNRRNSIVQDFTALDKDPQTREMYGQIGKKYGFTPEGGRIAAARCAEILGRLAARLQLQKAKGSPYFIGNSLTALDIYWACHAVTMLPLPETVCKMPELYRTVYTNTDPVIGKAAAPILFEHRDYIYEKHLELPVDF